MSLYALVLATLIVSIDAFAHFYELSVWTSSEYPLYELCHTFEVFGISGRFKRKFCIAINFDSFYKQQVGHAFALK